MLPSGYVGGAKTAYGPKMHDPSKVKKGTMVKDACFCLRHCSHLQPHMKCESSLNHAEKSILEDRYNICCKTNEELKKTYHWLDPNK